MLGSISSTDGHSCMLRAMCEAAATPHHSDGLLGDAINLVLSAGHALVGGEEELGEYRDYTQAQTDGQVRTSAKLTPCTCFRIPEIAQPTVSSAQSHSLIS